MTIRVTAYKQHRKDVIKDCQGIVTLKYITIDQFKEFMLSRGWIITSCYKD